MNGHRLSTTPTAFVAIPFKAPFLQTYESTIVPCLRTNHFKPILAPDIRASRDIMANIHTGIWNSRVVIADLSGCNPNVLFELGIALALNKQTIALTQSVEELPFDLRRDRVVVYRVGDQGRKQLVKELSAELKTLDHEKWTSVPSWKGSLHAEILPVPALLSLESQVDQEVWIIEPEGSFQDKAFHEVIIENLGRGITYRFVVLERHDVDHAFKTILKSFYGKQAQVVYVDERKLQLPLSLAVFDPMRPGERGCQYFPNGTTEFGIELSQPHLSRARQLFLSLWNSNEFRIMGTRPLGVRRGQTK